MDSAASSLLEGYATAAETAAELHICTKTLERWHLARRGPPRTRIGRRVFYKRSAVTAWLEKLQERTA